jgi:formylaminopyrimidine deformylase / aminopyrimidine aminohydrolase
VRLGSVPADAFDRWLAQDYLFARALVRAQSRIAAAAPFVDVGLLAEGVVAAVGELAAGVVIECIGGRAPRRFDR